MTTLWFGSRSSTRSSTDFDAGMAHQKLCTPAGGGFESRSAARMALLTMIGDEMVEVGSQGDLYCLKRLNEILKTLAQNPELDSAEVDGLKFAIWEVSR